jgi:glycosyltransferase involved in cell wall biosynthesis
LSLHGANLEIQPQEFQEEFRNLLARSPNNITMRGRYRSEELPHLMADVDWVVVPSKWWENSPLVIQEAFMHGRPVICSDIGGMAEKVTDGVNGLHFRVGNAASLADTIQKAVTTPHIWDILHAGLPTVYGMEAHIGSLADLYSKLLESRSLAAPELVS